MRLRRFWSIGQRLLHYNKPTDVSQKAKQTPRFGRCPGIPMCSRGYNKPMTQKDQPDVSKINKTPCEQQEDAWLPQDWCGLIASFTLTPSTAGFTHVLTCLLGIRDENKREKATMRSNYIREGLCVDIFVYFQDNVSEILRHSCLYEPFWIRSIFPNSTFNNFPSLLESCKRSNSLTEVSIKRWLKWISGGLKLPLLVVNWHICRMFGNLNWICGVDLIIVKKKRKKKNKETTGILMSHEKLQLM